MVSRIEVGWRQGEKEGTIPVDVVYSKRRTIGLEVQADGKVLIRAPKGITKKVLMDFVNDRQEWIVERVPDREAPPQKGRGSKARL